MQVARALGGLSAQGRAVVSRAYDEAYRYASDFVGSAHLLVGLLADTSHAITTALSARTVSVETVRRQFEQTTGAQPREMPRHIHLSYSPHAKAVLINAAGHARDAGSAMTDVDHLWVALSRAEGAVARHILTELGQLDYLRERCAEILKPDSES